jgi:hypothetical protein
MPDFLHPDKDNYSDDDLIQEEKSVRRVSEILPGKEKRWIIWKFLWPPLKIVVTPWITFFSTVRRDWENNTVAYYRQRIGC